MDLIAGEVEVIEKYISSDSIVFDVGSFVGEWSKEVLSRGLASHVHSFEPSPIHFQPMVENLKEFEKKLSPNNLAVGEKIGKFPFWIYRDVPVLSTLFKRNAKTMESLGIAEPEAILVDTITIDEYCRHYGIEHIDFLKIDAEGAEAAVIRGAQRLISNQNIGHIQFEYGGCFQDAGATLKEIFLYLVENGYEIGRIVKGDIQFISQFDPKMESYTYCNYLGKLKR